MDARQAQTARRQERIREISGAIQEIVGGVESEDAFYRQILDRMVVGCGGVDVYLKFLPFKWSYAAADQPRALRGLP